MTDHNLKTVADVISALGGVAAVQTLTEAKSPQVVTNWQARGRFSSHTYLLMTEALEAQQCTAPAALWGIVDPAESAPTPATG